MMQIEGRTEGSTSADVKLAYVDPCPRCGMCLDCREQIENQLRREAGLTEAMHDRAYARGFGSGLSVGIIGSLVVLGLAYALWAAGAL